MGRGARPKAKRSRGHRVPDEPKAKARAAYVAGASPSSFLPALGIGRSTFYGWLSDDESWEADRERAAAMLGPAPDVVKLAGEATVTGVLAERERIGQRR